MSCTGGFVRTLLRVGTLGVAGIAVGGTLIGCGGVPMGNINCRLKQGVFPSAAVADHMAAAPGNQQAFNVGYVNVPPGCAVPAVLISPQAYTWVSSDPVKAPISNAKDATAGVATCVGATTATVATYPAGTTQVATLTCK